MRDTPETLEREVEHGLRLLVERHGGLCRKWVCPGFSGVPDRLVILPGGRIYFVELKRPTGGKTAALQAWWGRRLTDLGCQYRKIATTEELKNFEKEITP